MAAILAAFSNPLAGAESSPERDACLLQAIAAAGETTTVAELRQRCDTQAREPAVELTEEPVAAVPVYEQQSAFEARQAEESGFEQRPFAITAHRPNYLLVSGMDEPNQAPFEQDTGLSDPVDDREVEFQVSIKAPLWRDVMGSGIDIYTAYTAKSYWQMFNGGLSAPFRETDHEPEVYFRSYNRHKVLGAALEGWSLGFNHQSNGRSEPLSRSWNRLLGETVVGLGSDLSLLVRAWYRIPESRKDDDNPHMHRYLGYGDLRAVWTPNRNTVTAMIRPGTEKSGFELTWSYPINRVFRVFALYYNGYGESLIDYDADIERIALGIALNDYLQRQH